MGLSLFSCCPDTAFTSLSFWHSFQRMQHCKFEILLYTWLFAMFCRYFVFLGHQIVLDANSWCSITSVDRYQALFLTKWMTRLTLRFKTLAKSQCLLHKNTEKKKMSKKIPNLYVNNFWPALSPGGEEQPQSNMETISNPTAVSVWRRHGQTHKGKPHDVLEQLDLQYHTHVHACNWSEFSVIT